MRHQSTFSENPGRLQTGHPPRQTKNWHRRRGFPSKLMVRLSLRRATLGLNVGTCRSLEYCRQLHIHNLEHFLFPENKVRLGASEILFPPPKTKHTFEPHGHHAIDSVGMPHQPRTLRPFLARAEEDVPRQYQWDCASCKYQSTHLVQAYSVSVNENSRGKSRCYDREQGDNSYDAPSTI